MDIQEQGKLYVKQIQSAQENFQANSAARSAVGKHIAALAEQIRSVESAMKEIQSISMQVKILSINASVEAARAGTAGKGFSVVAHEVGELAKNTDQAVSRIQSDIAAMHALLKNTQSDMQNAREIGAQFDIRLNDCVEGARRIQTMLETL